MKYFKVSMDAACNTILHIKVNFKFWKQEISWASKYWQQYKTKMDIK